MRRIILLAVLLPLAFLAARREAQAGTIIHQVGVVGQTNWGTTAMPVQVPRHDGALGPLRSVRVCLRGEVVRRVRVESLDAAPSQVTVSGLSSFLLVQRPSDSSQTLDVRRTPFPDFAFALAAHDGIVDFGGASGADSGALRRGLKPIDYILTDPADLAYFSGAALATVPFAARFESHLTGPGNLVAEIQALASLTGIVIYEYEDAPLAD